MNILFTSYSNSASGSSNVSRRYINLLKITDEILLSELYMYANHNSKEFSYVKVIEKLEAFYNKLLRVRGPEFYPYSSAKFGVLKSSYINKFDLVNIGWSNNGLISLAELAKITIPAVFTLHDMWMFSGGCHIEYECPLIQDSCKNCFIAKDGIATRAYDFKKTYIFRKNNFYYISPSEFLRNKAINAGISVNHIKVIRNGIDLDVFHDKKKDHVIGGLITFGFSAINFLSSKKKGYGDLIPFLEDISKRFPDKKILANCWGDPFIGCLYSSGSITIKSLGYFDNDDKISSLLNDCDIYLNLSSRENLSTTIVEAIACGLPVFSYDVGGNHEVIGHDKYFICEKNMPNIVELLSNKNIYIGECLDMRFRAIKYFDIKLTVKSYIDYFRGLHSEIIKASL